MAPLVLKIKGNKTFSSFSTLSSEDELSKTWRVCTKVKDSLENGSRLENLSWRLWFRQHSTIEKKAFKKLSTTTTRKLSSHVKIEPLKQTIVKLEQEEQPYMEQLLDQPLLDGCFLPQTNYTPFNDQSNADIVELNDIFNAFNNGFQIPTTDMGMADGWDFGYPSPTNPYYSPTQTPASPSTLLRGYEQTIVPSINENDAMYVSGSTMPPPPVATLRNKLLENQQMRFNKTPPMSTSTSASTIASNNSIPYVLFLSAA